jgi:ABC-type Fe3+-hydroxamate transport system substrate-binding protein
MRLDRAGIRTYSYRHAGLQDVIGTIDDLAAVTGRHSRGAELTSAIGAHLDEIRRRVQGRPQPRTLLVIGREPGSLRGMYVSGGVGFLHDMLVLAGGMNVFDDVARESVQPSMEVLLARGPEVIVELKPSSTSADADLGVWQRLSTIPAVRHARLSVLTGQHLVVPGSRIADAAESLARVLHPEAFR